MRFGIAEEGHHAVAEILGDMTAKAGDRVSDRALIAGDRLTPFFGIKLRSDPS